MITRLAFMAAGNSKPDDRGATIFAAFFVAVIVGILAIKKALERKRTRALNDTAVEMGFTFCGDDWTDKSHAPLLETALFGKGRGHRFRNIMTSERAGFRVSLFDYSFTVGGGRNKQTYTQTVATFSKDDACLPYFELRPANLMDKAWDAMTHKNIHFETDPEFARRYVLRGALPEKVRALFTPGLVSFVDGLDSQHKWHIEGAGRTLVIYRAKKKEPVEQMRTFLEQTTTVASTFLNLAGAATVTAMS
ncbi:MAG TPA: hypothetical protein VKB26_10150 [Candidatus Acidoferrales bacterium]|nr:hypothetical protein [Candidatus Acidoferrales bacterium]